MPDYDLNRLGSRAFEQMIVALGRLEIGPGVQVFGGGPDGGREATFDGTINWSATSKGVSDRTDSWIGYTVLQSKFQIKPAILLFLARLGLRAHEVAGLELEDIHWRAGTLVLRRKAGGVRNCYANAPG